MTDVFEVAITKSRDGGLGISINSSKNGPLGTFITGVTPSGPTEVALSASGLVIGDCLRIDGVNGERSSPPHSAACPYDEQNCVAGHLTQYDS